MFDQQPGAPGLTATGNARLASNRDQGLSLIGQADIASNQVCEKLEPVEWLMADAAMSATLSLVLVLAQMVLLYQQV